MNRILSMVFAAALLAALAVGWQWYAYRHTPLPIDASPARVRIERGMSLNEMSAALRTSGVRVGDATFWLAARLRGDSRAIKAGTYDIKAPSTLAELLDKFVRGDVVLAELRIPEGWTFRQMRAAVAAHPELQHDSVALSEGELLARIGATATRAEGWFFPSTYRFSPGSSDFDVYRQAHRLMQKALAEAWAARAPGLPFDAPEQVLILASIVEKETGQAGDRDRVAAVFVNRLRRGMPLQSDPTTIYGLGERFDGNLRRSDLRTDHPHNTYTRTGLPPTPIALPGSASLYAATHPAPIRALYFVARGDGSSEFSDDLTAHNRAVARYQLRRPTDKD
ncbi:MAG: endolytic transglycosylase MltG [Burkholderiaceae bacterium]|nr:MAG: endolytic transglycosylase MltG [Burkholderiaceae bacterium]